MGRNHKNKKKIEWVGIAKKQTNGVGLNCKKKWAGSELQNKRNRWTGLESQKNNNKK